MKKRTVITRLGDIDWSNCIACDSFFKKSEIEKRYSPSKRKLRAADLSAVVDNEQT
jgi:hypothetical protein